MTLPTDVPGFDECYGREEVYPEKSIEKWTELVDKN